MRDDVTPTKIQPHSADEVWIDEGLFVTELLNDPASPALSVARCRLPAMCTTQAHRLTVDEVYLIEQGAGMMTLGSETFPVDAGETVIIPRGVLQAITNTQATDLVFQVICTPRFTPSCYEACGEPPEAPDRSRGNRSSQAR